MNGDIVNATFFDVRVQYTCLHDFPSAAAWFFESLLYFKRHTQVMVTRKTKGIGTYRYLLYRGGA